MFNTNPKRGPETFLVSKSAQTVTLNNATSGAGAPLFTGRTPITGLVDGRIGLVSMGRPATNASSYYVYEDSTPSDEPFRILQGTADSQDLGSAWRNRTYPLTPKAYFESAEIRPGQRIRVSAQIYTAPTNTVWVIGDTGALATGGIVPVDNTEYALTVSYRGRIVNEYFSPEATAFFTPSYTTPDYTALGTAFPVDHLVQNMVWSINRNSVILGDYPQANESVVGIALDLTGIAGTLVSAITPGFLPLVNTDSGVRGITLDADLVATLQAALPAGSSIVTVDRTTAGSANTTQSFALLALDRRFAYVDENTTTKIRIDVGLRYGFAPNTTQIARTSNAKEAQGSERQLRLWWKATHAQRLYSLDHEQIPVITYPSPFETGVNYNTLIIENTDVRPSGVADSIHSPHKTIVAIPTGNAVWTEFTTNFQAWTNDNGLGLLADWLS